MKTLAATFLMLSSAVLFAACSKPIRADVNCSEHQQGFNCAVTTKGAPNANVNICWDINVKCGDGQSLTANSCQEMAGEGKASTIVPNSKFTGGTCKVNKIAGISVSNVKITQK